jgi:signal transduction histidine kinase
MNIFAFTGLINGLGATLFGILGYWKNRSSFLHKLFLVMNITIAFWGYSYFFWLISNNHESAYFWVALLSLGANFIPILYVHWALTLFKLNKKKKHVIRYGYIVTILFSLFVFTPLYIADLRPISGFKFWPQGGALHFLYIVLLYLGLSSYGTLQLIKIYKKSRGTRRNQIQYVIVGSFIGFGCGFFNFPLWYGIEIKPFLNFGVVFYAATLTYAMVKHRLMDIKFVLRKYSVYLVTIASIVSPALILKYFSYSLFPKLDILIDFIILIAAITIFPTLKNYYYNLATKYFFSSLYDDRQVIGKLSERLSSTLDINKIYKFIGGTLINSFHAKTASILLFNMKKKKYTVEFDIGHKTGSSKSFVEDKGFYSNVIKHNRVIVVEELIEQHHKEYKRTIKFLERYEVEILVPLRIKQRVIGVIALGPKESRDMYNDEDMRVLGVIGSQSAIAIENALLFEETKEFSIKLEREVEQATKELREANEKLKKLDQAKSEFISIASHQLRTPLTVVKGYISMILEGSYGKIATERRLPLEKVFESNERLIQLVENLLNISRIESGRLRFSFERMRFEKLVAGVVDELKGTAKKKGLSLIFNTSNISLPKVKIDEEKIRQVVLNLVDNAIKYSIKGSVIVKVEKKDKEILFCVSDKGMGIRREDLSGLFKKFSRGTDTPLVNPGGTGLGLYVARIMIEAHDGKIWAESAGPGKGAKFCFTIPIK